MITFVAAVLLKTFSEDVLTALTPSELRITVYKDLMSSDTNYELSGIFFNFFITFDISNHWASRKIQVRTRQYHY